MSVGTKLLQAAAGNAGEAVYVDDLFSTTLYTGTDGSVVVPTGLDLADKGGLIWGKSRSGSQNHRMYDSVRGTQYSLIPNATSAQSNQGTQTFGSSSVTLGAGSGIVGSSSYGGPDYVLWSFAKQEKFFDIVTYTGDGSNNRAISHNLGSTPGFIIIKSTSNSTDWVTFHRGYTYPNWIRLNSTDTQGTTYGDAWSTGNPPTSTTFTLGSGGFGDGNYNGRTYVAYLFAHNDGDGDYGEGGDEDIIKCDSFTTDGNGDAAITLGFEPQWLLIKRTDQSNSWWIADSMRGLVAKSAGGDAYLNADQNYAEDSTYTNYIYPTATGFEMDAWGSSGTYIYMAIRRPHKPASEFAATDLFTLQAQSPGEGADTFISTGFNVDTVIYRSRATSATSLGDRLRGQSGGGDLLTNSTGAEGTNAGAFFLDHSNGVTVDYAGGHFNIAPAATDKNYIRYFLRRAKGFFDVVAYTGDGTSTSFSHNLGATPELKIIKNRDASFNWVVGGDIVTGGTSNNYIQLNSDGGTTSSSDYWKANDTASVFSVRRGNNLSNANGVKYIAYLFATVAGISKVGSYTGTGSDLNVDCGFSAGARFVLIKRTDSTGDWYLYDSARGIVAGNDPYVFLNATDAEVTNTDYIDPLSSGFTVTSSAPAGLNASSGTYIFLAIA